MVNLYLLPTWLLVALCLWAMVSFVAESVLHYFLTPQATFRDVKRKLLELAPLLLLLSFLGLPDEALDALTTGIFVTRPFFLLRLGLAGFGSVMALPWLRRGEGSLYVLAASLLLLPFFDRALPWNLMAALLLLDIRIARLLPAAYRHFNQDVTENAIGEAVDTLTEGIFLCRDNGEPVLVNHAMDDLMHSLLGTTIRNGSILWHLLGQGGLPTARLERVGRNLLFHMAEGGKVYLLSRAAFSTPDGSGWQITGSDVTRLYRMNRDLEERNDALRQRNEDMKELLSHVVDLESRDTLREIRYKVHDMMGQRISYLQQILNNKDYKNYGRIGELLSHLLDDMEQEISMKPDLILSELAAGYQSLGIRLTVFGSLPAGSLGSLFVEIIREAASNAIVHGKASEISVTFTTDSVCRMAINDNGVGTKGPIQEGGGLTSIRAKVEEQGGTATYSGGEHFTLAIEVPLENA